jgi:hypothetical protein
MTHFVQILNGEVKQVWDTAPSEGVGNNGWKNAVEVRPTITSGRQGYTAHRFDLTVDPVQIIWDTYDISVADRKGSMSSNAGSEFQMVVNQQVRNPATYDAEAIETARLAMVAKQAAIEACTTHDELDAI